MNGLKIFLLTLFNALFILVGCQKEEEEPINLDEMVFTEELEERHLAGEPMVSPQEILIKEPPLSFSE